MCGCRRRVSWRWRMTGSGSADSLWSRLFLFVVGCIVGAPTLRYRDATTPSFDAALPGLSHFLVAVPVLLLRRCWLSQYADSGLSIAAPARPPRRAAPNQSRPGHLHTLSLAVVSSPPSSCSSSTGLILSVVSRPVSRRRTVYKTPYQTYGAIRSR